MYLFLLKIGKYKIVQCRVTAKGNVDFAVKYIYLNHLRYIQLKCTTKNVPMGQFFTTSRYHRKGLDLVPNIKVQLYVNACTFKKNILSQDCNAAVEFPLI